MQVEKTQKAVSLSIVGGQASDIGLKPAKVRGDGARVEGHEGGFCFPSHRALCPYSVGKPT